MDPRYIDGAIASYAALTTPKGMFLVTTTLAKLSFVGLIIQAAALLRRRITDALAAAVFAHGCGLILLFWDQDNWMLVGVVLMAVSLWVLGRDRSVGERPRVHQA